MTREDATRAHVVMPKDVVERIDALVGPRRRSEFVVEAVQKELTRRNRSEMGRRPAGSLADVDIPGWESSEAAAEWVHQLRYHPEALVPVASGSDRDGPCGPTCSTRPR